MLERNESAILARIRERFPGGEALTDDCGLIPQVAPGQRLLVTTDVMEEGQHFCTAWHPPRMLGRKLLMVNLSDLDASGAVPLGFTFTLSLARDFDLAWLEAFLDGLAEAARECQVPVIGGDTVGRATGLGLGITAFGAASRWLRRDEVQPGDACVDCASSRPASAGMGRTPILISRPIWIRARTWAWACVWPGFPRSTPVSISRMA
jgi:thiamine-monophosphate kinase